MCFKEHSLGLGTLEKSAALQLPLFNALAEGQAPFQRFHLSLNKRGLVAQSVPLTRTPRVDYEKSFNSRLTIAILSGPLVSGNRPKSQDRWRVFP